MGVLGLWQLLAPVGHPVALESLESKIFAVDISIWLNQAVKGYRDSQGGSVPNAHLLSLFSRLCKLLFYKIRPIIVFDGGFPELKRQTIINRQQRRAAAKQDSRDFSLKILSNYIASRQLGSDSSSFKKPLFNRKEKPREEIFKLPPLPESSQVILSDSCDGDEDYERKFTNFSQEDIKYLNQIDLESEDFDALPLDVKQEILSTLKESRKHSSWDHFNDLPRDSDAFSGYQMQCLLKKRKLQSKLENVQREMRQASSSAYVSQYTSDHVIGETNKIMSDDASYYVLLKKITQHRESPKDIKPASSIMADTKSAFIKDIENIDFDENDFSLDSEVNTQSLDIKACKQPSEADDVKLLETYQVAPKIKTEVDYLDLSDGEDVDNPRLLDGINKNMDGVKLLETCQMAPEIKTEVGYLNLSDEENVDNPPLLEGINKNMDKGNNQYPTPNVLTLGKIADPSPEFETNEENVLPKTENLFKPEKQVPVASSTKQNLEMNKSNENVDKPSLLEKTNQNIDKNMDKENNQHPDPNVKTLTQTINSSSEFETDNEKMLPVTKNIFKQMSVASSTEPNVETIHVQNPENKYEFERLAKECDSDSVSQVRNRVNEDENSPLTFKGESGILSPAPVDNGANLELEENLRAETDILEAEQAKIDRQASTVQDHMVEECKELLRLFGIPYVVSPSEAEAQCAFYDTINFTHGTITDDSDAWLFGAKRVYKNFFAQQKVVECYKDNEIFSHFGLNREKLVNFALLTGSDYTEGIEGVGPVTAMEIIAEFPGDGIEALGNFKEWWKEVSKGARPPENKVRAKLAKLVLAEDFPNRRVSDAYLNPEVDNSRDKFTWGRPDLDAIRDYARERFGWNQSKVDNSLLPVLKKLSEREKQTRLDGFFTVTLKKEKEDLFPSKRIVSALKKITSPHKQQKTTENVETTKTRKRKPRCLGMKRAPKKTIRRAVSDMSKKSIESHGPNLSEDSSSDS